MPETAFRHRACIRSETPVIYKGCEPERRSSIAAGLGSTFLPPCRITAGGAPFPGRGGVVRHVVRIPTNGRLLLKAVEPEPPRNRFTCEGSPQRTESARYINTSRIRGSRTRPKNECRSAIRSVRHSFDPFPVDRRSPVRRPSTRRSQTPSRRMSAAVLSGSITREVSCADGGRPIIPGSYLVGPDEIRASDDSARSSKSPWVPGRTNQGLPGEPPKKSVVERPRRGRHYSSRCSIPFLETFASVISSGIQSGLSSGASSSHAQPS